MNSVCLGSVEGGVGFLEDLGVRILAASVDRDADAYADDLIRYRELDALGCAVDNGSRNRACDFRIVGILDEDDEFVYHNEYNPSAAICCKIADMEDALWTDYDWCNMPYDKETGDVWDTDSAISPNENYRQTATWLLDEYKQIVETYGNGETEDDDYYIDDDDEDYE